MKSLIVLSCLMTFSFSVQAGNIKDNYPSTASKKIGNCLVSENVVEPKANYHSWDFSQKGNKKIVICAPNPEAKMYDNLFLFPGWKTFYSAIQKHADEITNGGYEFGLILNQDWSESLEFNGTVFISFKDSHNNFLGPTVRLDIENPVFYRYKGSPTLAEAWLSFDYTGNE